MAFEFFAKRLLAKPFSIIYSKMFFIPKMDILDGIQMLEEKKKTNTFDNSVQQILINLQHLLKQILNFRLFIAKL